MTRFLLAFVSSLTLAAPAAAQWLDYPTPGLPRTADGKPDLTAPAPRTADGRPDLSGIWRFNGLGYSFNIFGTQTVEMLPWAQAVFAERSITFARESPDTLCLPPGPRAGLFGMDPVKFVQTKDLLLILYEDTPTRQVFLDARPLPRDPNPTWMGYSVGRWDGDTLVIDSAGFNDRTWLDLTGHPHTDALHVTERFRRLDVGRMQLEMTFEDPKTYTRPWTIAVDVELIPDTELLENICQENEKDRSRLIGNATADTTGALRLPVERLTRYVGDYQAGPLGLLHITVDGGRLALILPGGNTRHPLVAQSEEMFLAPDIGSPIRFLTGPGGEITHLRVTIVEGDIDAPRVARVAP